MFNPWSACTQRIPAADGKISEVATLDCIPVVFQNVLSILLAFAGTIALVMFIIGGVKYMTSAGDSKKLEGARNNFVFGIIGLSIVIFSFLFMRIIATVTGVECIADITKFGFECR